MSSKLPVGLAAIFTVALALLTVPDAVGASAASHESRALSHGPHRGISTGWSAAGSGADPEAAGALQRSARASSSTSAGSGQPGSAEAAAGDPSVAATSADGEASSAERIAQPLNSVPTPAPTGSGRVSDAASVGFDWPNAVSVYVNHWDQQSVAYADRSRPFRVAAANGVHIMRTFFGTVDSFRATLSGDPAVRTAAWADLGSILDDAAANGVQLILSNYLTEEAVEVLAGRTYGSWAEARRALVTEGSPAWRGLQNWIEEATRRYHAHAGTFSWEVVNEPGWMLGIDDGSISQDTAAVFLDSFQGQYKRAGVMVNAGGRPKFDTTLLSDDQVRLMTRNVDLLDDHLYPEGGSADALLDAAEKYRHRVAALTGRTLPFVIGEFGTQPSGFFHAVMAGAEKRGFLRVVWGFDAYDSNGFSDRAGSNVLDAIAAENSVRTDPAP